MTFTQDNDRSLFVSDERTPSKMSSFALEWCTSYRSHHHWCWHWRLPLAALHKMINSSKQNKNNIDIITSYYEHVMNKLFGRCCENFVSRAVHTQANRSTNRPTDINNTRHTIYLTVCVYLCVYRAHCQLEAGGGAKSVKQCDLVCIVCVHFDI